MVRVDELISNSEVTLKLWQSRSLTALQMHSKGQENEKVVSWCPGFMTSLHAHIEDIKDIVDVLTHLCTSTPDKSTLPEFVDRLDLANTTDAKLHEYGEGLRLKVAETPASKRRRNSSA